MPYLMYFVVVMLLFQLLAKHSLATLPWKQIVNKCLTRVNNSFVHYTRTHICSLAIMNHLFSLLNAIGLKRTIDSARPTSTLYKQIHIGIRL